MQSISPAEAIVNPCPPRSYGTPGAWGRTEATSNVPRMASKRLAGVIDRAAVAYARAWPKWYSLLDRVEPLDTDLPKPRLVREIFQGWLPIADPSEAEMMVAATHEQLRAIVPVTARILEVPSIDSSGASEIFGIAMRIAQDEKRYDLTGEHGRDLIALMRSIDSQKRDGRYPSEFAGSVRDAWRAEARAYWHEERRVDAGWIESERQSEHAPRSSNRWPFAQPTFPEARRIAQGLADGPDGQRWASLPGVLGLIHKLEKATHDLTLDGSRLVDWWGKPNDNESLLAELRHTGAHGIATLYNAIGLVLLSEDGFVDVELDEIISRIGLDPRSKAERAAARLKVWRILTVISALCVTGERRKTVKDRVTSKMVTVQSDDALLTVRAMRLVGSQEGFDAGSAPIMVTISASPWIAKWKHDRRVLSDFGAMLQVTSIPIGQPSGAWARAVGHALQQLWREGATHSTTSYVRVGDDHKLSVKFRAFTRRELLELFPPEPRVQEVLKSANPSRAIQYWEAAIAELKTQSIIGYYAKTRDWKTDRPRKNWEAGWLDEPLDIRPAQDGSQALLEIATSAKRQKRSSARSTTRAAVEAGV